MRTSECDLCLRKYECVGIHAWVGERKGLTTSTLLTRLGFCVNHGLEPLSAKLSPVGSAHALIKHFPTTVNADVRN